MFTPEPGGHGALFVGISDSPLSFEHVQHTAEPRVIEVLRTEHILVAGLPDVVVVQFVGLVETVKRDVLFIFFSVVVVGVVKVFVLVWVFGRAVVGGDGGVASLDVSWGC